MEMQSFKLNVNYIKKVAFLSYDRIKPFKSYAPLAQLVEQLTLKFACGECCIGSRVRIGEAELCPMMICSAQTD